MSDLPYTLKSMKELNTADGVAFSAQLYRGRKKIRTLENTGTGGADVLHLTDAAEHDRWDQWIQTLAPFEYPPCEIFPEGMTVTNKTESAYAHLHHQYDEAAEARQLDRLSKTSIIALKDGGPHTPFTTITFAKGKAGPQHTQSLLPQIFKTHPGVMQVWVVGTGWVKR